MSDGEVVAVFVFYSGSEDDRLEIIATATSAPGQVTMITPYQGYFTARIDRGAARAICADQRVTGARELALYSPS